MFPFLIVKEFAILQWWTSSQVFFLKKTVKILQIQNLSFFPLFNLSFFGDDCQSKQFYLAKSSIAHLLRKLQSEISAHLSGLHAPATSKTGARGCS